MGGGCLGVVSPLHGRGVIGLEQLLGRQLQEQVLGQLSLLQKKPGPGVVVLVAGKERTDVVIGCRGLVREACAASPTSDHGLLFKLVAAKTPHLACNPHLGRTETWDLLICHQTMAFAWLDEGSSLPFCLRCRPGLKDEGGRSFSCSVLRPARVYSELASRPSVIAAGQARRSSWYEMLEMGGTTTTTKTKLYLVFGGGRINKPHTHTHTHLTSAALHRGPGGAENRSPPPVACAHYRLSDAGGLLISPLRSTQFDFPSEKAPPSLSV